MARPGGGAVVAPDCRSVSREDAIAGTIGGDLGIGATGVGLAAPERAGMAVGLRRPARTGNGGRGRRAGSERLRPEGDGMTAPTARARANERRSVTTAAERSTGS